MEEINKLSIIINFEDGFFSSTSDKTKAEALGNIGLISFNEEGFYKDKIKEIKKVLFFPSRAEILKIVYVFPEITPTQIKNITLKTYSLTQRNLKMMKDLKILRSSMVQSKRGMNESKLTINEDIKIYKYSDFLKEDKIFNELKRSELDKAISFEKSFEEELKGRLVKAEVISRVSTTHRLRPRRVRPQGARD